MFAYHHQESEKVYTTDVFIFDTTKGELVEVMLGINYAKMAKASMQRILARLSPEVAKPTPPSGQSPECTSTAHTPTPVSSKPIKVVSIPKVKIEKKHQSAKPDIKSTVRTLLANVSGLEPEEISDNVELADIGIDALMVMELAREVEIAFKCTLRMEKLIEVTDFLSFVDCIKSSLPPMEKGAAEDNDDDDDNETEESSSEDSLLSK